MTDPILVIAPLRRPSLPRRLGAALAMALLVSACGNSSGPATAGSDSTGTITGPISTGTGSGGLTGATASTGCGSTLDPASFASTGLLRDLTRTVANRGLRAPGSDAHNANIQWIEDQLRRMPGLTIESEPYAISRWEATPVAADGSRDLEQAGSLGVTTVAGVGTAIPVAGAIPQALPTTGRSGALVYLPNGTAITAANARGRIVIRDFVAAPIPYPELAAVSWYLTPDLVDKLAGNYDRPYIAIEAVTTDLIAAGSAGAAGLVSVFDVPRQFVTGYWDPHQGTRFTIPAVFVGVDEGTQLKALATAGATATMAIAAKVDATMTRNLIATLPGVSAERIILATHTDGVGYVEENGDAALLAFADYFSRRPMECRPRTLQFVFNSSHLSYRYDGLQRVAQRADDDYDDGSIAFAFPIEHLGTRAIEPVARTDGGPGQTLAFNGQGEPLAWFSGAESPVMAQAVITAVQNRGLDYIGVLKGQDVPDPTRAPMQCSQGGLGTIFQEHLVPTMSIISGPWSLWAPSFGEAAIDFERMHEETLAIGDVILALGGVSRELIAGTYPLERQQRAAGFPTCVLQMPPEQAPSAS